MHAHVYVTDSPNVPPHKKTPSMRSEAAQILETPLSKSWWLSSISTEVLLRWALLSVFGGESPEGEKCSCCVLCMLHPRSTCPWVNCTAPLLAPPPRGFSMPVMLISLCYYCTLEPYELHFQGSILRCNGTVSNEQQKSFSTHTTNTECIFTSTKFTVQY